ncbi:hypothetical protein BD410DRAFT_796257 [Rickenella mellea]|uniref:Uncharacterized protein n=1 Tax=Rickenella mellea TaxID=50990 RepID=A0A4Y7PM97_9AGAM|nr:hypothetical protein BD410DRAFT_796257 [Rickenella mellea]
MSETNLSLCVPRTSSGRNPNEPVLVESPIPTTNLPNHILLRVDRFGFSANNITYQALGEVPHFRYFDFHLAPRSKDNTVTPESHGLIPVWGFGTVVWSSHPRVAVGERVYGYFAPTRYLLLPVSPSDANKYSFFVPRPHFPADRRPYNQIIRCANDALYDPTPDAEDLTMLYRPLFWTSFWCEDWLAESSYRSGETQTQKNVLISSASAKTSFCLAYLVRKRFVESGVNIVGLTSARNESFTRGLGLYDEVLNYDALKKTLSSAQSAAHAEWIYVDVAGSEEINENVRACFEKCKNSRLLAHISLGMTTLSPSSSNVTSKSWTTNTSLLSAPSITMGANPDSKSSRLPNPEEFFMPEWLALRRKALSVTEITQMQAKAWKELMRDCRGWVKMECVEGGENVLPAYEKVVKDGVGPEKGLVWSMWDRTQTEEERNTNSSKL